MKGIAAKNLIVLDESGAHLAMTRYYGRAESHQRLCYSVPYARGNNYSMIAAITPKKIVGSWYCEGAIDGHFFTEFIKHFLVPMLTPNHGVVMDNVAFHKVKPAVELIQNTGAQIFYLPPYSPDFSPIEMMWSKVKAVLRKQAARTADAFQKAIAKAFYSIQNLDLKNWFIHCGFKL